jgi:hypothetical protein
VLTHSTGQPKDFLMMTDDSAMDGQPEPDADDQGMGGGSMEMCIPLSSLSQPDEQDNMQAPAVGDPVTFTAEGTISRIDGDNAYIQPTAVNGQKIDNSTPQMPEEDRLRQMASAMPANPGNY